MKRNFTSSEWEWLIEMCDYIESPNRYKQVVVGRSKGETFAGIGRKLGIGSVRVQQIFYKSLRRIERASQIVIFKSNAVAS